MVPFHQFNCLSSDWQTFPPLINTYYHPGANVKGIRVETLSAAVHTYRFVTRLCPETLLTWKDQGVYILLNTDSSFFFQNVKYTAKYTYDKI